MYSFMATRARIEGIQSIYLDKFLEKYTIITLSQKCWTACQLIGVHDQNCQKIQSQSTKL